MTVDEYKDYLGNGTIALLYELDILFGTSERTEAFLLNVGVNETVLSMIGKIRWALDYYENRSKKNIIKLQDGDLS